MTSSTTHQLVIDDARSVASIADYSVDLVVTSPPYPMIKMWDDIYSRQNKKIRRALTNGKGSQAFELMHGVLDRVWKEVDRTLVPGGICCINIGDATRTIGGHFSLYPNHQRVQQQFLKLGYQCLPSVLWRKITNAPNKFMGSGMMPPSAYVTLEHEWILIFRKNGRRQFESDEKQLNRQASAYFWEERNVWFNDLWQLPGTTQQLNMSGRRSRSGAFPFELPYRLINMYSVKKDTVLDPFLGTGTTMFAAMVSERNSIGIEIDESLRELFLSQISAEKVLALNQYASQRLKQHEQFVREFEKPINHFNANHNFPVVTRQETQLRLRFIESVQARDNQTVVNYTDEEPIIPKVS
ncbi:MAG: site-specific DNA-methyltransferase [Gammaproteobacteria bacterium]|nr:site-specific DNA-methyltransferase [Gammaproteobacteria bacterium]MYC24545.1 site-specific DNA-methyltransferase [Gammaproteobacteria bacterium]